MTKPPVPMSFTSPKTTALMTANILPTAAMPARDISNVLTRITAWARLAAAYMKNANATPVPDMSSKVKFPADTTKSGKPVIPATERNISTKSTPVTASWNAPTPGRKTARKSAGAATLRHTAVASPAPISATWTVVRRIMSANMKTAPRNITRPAAKTAISGTKRPKPARRNAIRTTEPANVRENIFTTKTKINSAAAPSAQPKMAPNSTKHATSRKRAILFPLSKWNTGHAIQTLGEHRKMLLKEAFIMPETSVPIKKERFSDGVVNVI